MAYLIILAVSAVVGVAVYFASGWWMERMADKPTANWSSEAVLCDGCGRDCRDEYWGTGRLVECDDCNSRHFNAAIGNDMDDVDAMLPPRGE